MSLTLNTSWHARTVQTIYKSKDKFQNRNQPYWGSTFQKSKVSTSALKSFFCSRQPDLESQKKFDKETRLGVSDSCKGDKLSQTMSSIPSKSTRRSASEHEILIRAQNERSTLPSRVLFGKIFSLNPKLNEFALFGSTDYKEYIQVDIQPRMMTMVENLIGTEAGPNFFSMSILNFTRASQIKHQNFPKLKSANKGPIRLERAILLHSQIRYLDIRVSLEAAKNLAANLLLGASFIDKFGREMVSTER